MASLIGVGGFLGSKSVEITGFDTDLAEGKVEVPREINKLILYAKKVFIEPFKAKKYSLVEDNYFNFEYIINKLNTQLTQYPQDGEIYKSIDTYINTICSIQRAMDIRLSLTNCFTDAFSDKQSNSVILETSRLSLSNVYFVYTHLLGTPVHIGDYDKDKLNIIKTALTNYPGIIMNELRDNPDILAIIP